MAYTPTYYNKRVHRSEEMSCWGIVRWLLNDQTSTSTTATYDDAENVGPAGPGWRLVACRSNNNLFQNQATGSITTIAKASLIDNETFVLDDGVVPAMTFEFNVSGTATIPVTSVEVDVSGDTTADNVRDTVVTAINNRLSLLTIEAVSGGAATVTLKNVVPGTASNTTQSDTVANVGFVITNMTGAVQSRGNGTLSGLVSTGDGIPTNWRDGSLVNTDWAVLQSDRRTALGPSAQALGFLKPQISATALVFTINGTTLTGVAGARTPGSDDFNMSLGTIALIVADMVAAINDSANSFTTIVQATDNTTEVQVDAVVGHFGLLGNLVDLGVTQTTGGVRSKVASNVSSDVEAATLGGGITSNEMEIYITNQATGGSELEFLVIPDATDNGGFDTSTADAAPPTFPTTSFGEGIQNPVDVDTNIPGNLDGTWQFCFVADEGMFGGFIEGQQLANVRHIYFGDYEGHLPGTSKPFLCKGTSTQLCYWDVGQFSSYWKSISPVDGTTFITGYAASPHQPAGADFIQDSNDMIDGRLGTFSFMPVGVSFTTTGAFHFAGFLRNTWAIHYRTGMRGTMGNRSYAWRVSTINANAQMPIVIQWDGLTRY